MINCDELRIIDPLAILTFYRENDILLVATWRLIEAIADIGSASTYDNHLILDCRSGERLEEAASISDCEGDDGWQRVRIILKFGLEMKVCCVFHAFRL